MVRTAWKATRDVDAMFWVLDAWKCFTYGDFIPEEPMLDGIVVGPRLRDAWWTHPELEEELNVLRRIKKMRKEVHVVLNKIDLLREMDVNVDEFSVQMRERLLKDLGSTVEGGPLLKSLWPTSVLNEPDTLLPIRKWLCDNLPQQSPIYPVSAVSDVPARVVASEITREKLFGVLNKELPYVTAVVNSVWRELPDGRLALGQKVVVKTWGQSRIVKGCLRQITADAEKEISETINFGKPVELHFKISIEPGWQDDEEYYSDVQGLLGESSLAYPK